MKKFVLFKNNTSWLPSLLVTSLCTAIMFVLGLVVLILDIVYTNEINSDKANNINQENPKFIFDVIVYPISFVIAIIEVIMAIYLCFNMPIWWRSLRKSTGERKKFNTYFCYPATIFVILILIDGLIRFFYVVGYFSEYLNNVNGTDALSVINITKDGILGNFKPTPIKKFGNFGFNTLLLMIFSGGFFCFVTPFYFIQKIKFKSEREENSKREVQDYYRKLEKEKIRKELNKNKPKDLKKTIKSF